MITAFEEWRFVPGSGNRYRVSNVGQIFNVRRGRFQKPSLSRDGYYRVTMTFPGRRPKSFLLHTIVAAAFHGPKSNRRVVNHKNGLKYDNSALNLEYVTQSENCRHAARLGLLPTLFKAGVDNPNCKLSEAQVTQIYIERFHGAKLKDLALRFGVSISTIHRVANRPGWNQLDFTASFAQPKVISGCETHVPSSIAI